MSGTKENRQSNPKDIVIYDGECNFCIFQIEKIKLLDRSGERFQFLSLHDSAARQHCPDLTTEMLMKEMYVIDTRGSYHAGPQAVRYIAAKLPLLWIFLPILHFKPTYLLISHFYRLVAANRYRISGRSCTSNNCKLH